MWPRGQVINLWGSKQERLTAYKSLSHSPVGRGEVAGALWGVFQPVLMMPGKHQHQEKQSLLLSCPFWEKGWRLNIVYSKPVALKGPSEMSLGLGWVRPMVPLARGQGQSRPACLWARFCPRLPLSGGPGGLWCSSTTLSSLPRMP